MVGVEQVVWLGMAGTGSRPLAAVEVLYGVGVAVATLSRALGLGRRLPDDAEAGVVDLPAQRWRAVAASAAAAGADSADLVGVLEAVASRSGMRPRQAGVRGRELLDMVWGWARRSHRGLIEQAAIEPGPGVSGSAAVEVMPTIVAADVLLLACVEVSGWALRRE